MADEDETTYTFDDFASDFLPNCDPADLDDGGWLPSWANE